MAFTYFFRDMQTLELIRDLVMPTLRTSRYINIWDAGCAMGPEPYSIAIILRENMGQFLFRNVRIFASDIEEHGSFGDIIREGVYAEEEVKRIPKDIFSKYFKPSDQKGCFQISEEIRKSVLYQKHNLLSLKPIREGFGLVVCKNVLLHFSEAERIKVIEMYHRVLDDGGFFVTEQTQKMPSEAAHMFEPVVSNASLFRKVRTAA